MNHNEAGIRKRVSEAVYPADILSEPGLIMASLEAFGAWMKTLLVMWRDDQPNITHTLAHWSRLWGVPEDRASAIIAELSECNVCNVTNGNGSVTLISRRLSRRAKERTDTAKRVAKHRAQKDGNEPVTTEKATPSISSSLSVTSIDSPKPPEGGKKKRLTEAQKKRARCDTITPLQIRIGALFNRKPTTPWSLYDAAALEELMPITEEELTVMERFYAAKINGDIDPRRRSLDTLLNNWNGELDKARKYKPPYRGPNL